MAKGSSRFRNRKIGFKTRLNVVTGAHAAEFEEDIDGGEVAFEEDKDQGKGVETGVDKEEEHELHLQAVLASATATVSGASGGASGGGAAPAKAFIPTPDALGKIEKALFDSLYARGYVDPVSYIRFSDTVEDAQTGAPTYTMDDDDEEWLEAYNAALSPNGKPPPTPAGADKGKDRKGKGKEVGLGPISDDQFEELMELFEHRTEEKAPMAHLDLATLPTLDIMEAAFDDANVRTEVAGLKSYAAAVYDHWRARRVKRGGRPIIPQLDYDESNEQNPYVCFRRRELKTSRKTRRSDQQNLERLIRLRNDLYCAHALMQKTRDRERLKLEAVQLERRVFEGRVEMRELKRRVGEADGDEDLLIGRREKRKRREDVQQAGVPPGAPGAPNGIKVSLRRPEAGVLSPASLVTPIEDLKLRKERAAAVAQRVERDLQKKREQDGQWDDFTDTAYVPRLPPVPARYWRAVEPVPGTIPYIGPNGKREALGFATTYQHAVGPARTSFRRRIGRGGRIMLDRISDRATRGRPHPPVARSDGSEEEADAQDDAEEDPFAASRLAERFKFDSDVASDFPSAEEPTVVDDYAFAHLARRSSLLRPADVESLSLDGSYLEDAYRWAAQEPDRNVAPPLVYGRPIPRPPVQQHAAAAGPGGLAMPGHNGVPSQASQAVYSQMQLAAQQARLLAQQQAQLKRANGQQQQPNGVGGAAEGMRKTPSNGNAGPNGMHIPMPSPLAMNGPGGGPVQAQWANAGGVASPGGVRVAQGMNGANGLPATSRLSGPPLLQQVHAHSPLNPASPVSMGVGRPGSAQGMVGQQPSRPGSAASGHGLSPALAAQGLPMGMVGSSGGGRPSPGPGGKGQAQVKRMGASPGGQQAYAMQAGQGGGIKGQAQGGMQGVAFGGFVQG